MKKNKNSKNRAAVIAAGAAAMALLASCHPAHLPVETYPRSEYPDYRVTQKVSEKSFGTCSPAQLQDKLKGYRNPEMMSLGGSVFNGVSSLQINWWLADWSPPMQVARALMNVPSGKIPGFAAAPYPDYGSPPYGDNPDKKTTFRLGLDLEKLHLTSLPQTIRDQASLMGGFKDYKTYKPSSDRLFSDNLASGGSAIEDILYGTATDYRRRLFATDPDSLDKDPSGIGKTFSQELDEAAQAKSFHTLGAASNLIKVFYAENSSFVLDPQRDPCISEMTALDEVLLRQPKRLLVGVGSNSGLFTFLIEGQEPDALCADLQFSFGDKVAYETRYVTIAKSAQEEFIQGMGKLIDKLAKEGSGIETIYVLGQLRPSAVANLKPWSGGKIPPTEKNKHEYFAKYRLDFDFQGSKTLSGELVRTVDDLNHDINEDLKKIVFAQNATGKPRFVYVDLETMSDKYDFKHTNDDQQRIKVTHEYIPGLAEPVYLDNRVLTFSDSKDEIANGKPIGLKIEQGGIFSIDNLHPTVIGYSLIANTILDSIETTEHVRFAPGAREIVDPRAVYARAIDGNILRQRDRGLAHRENYLQVGFNIMGALHRPHQCVKK